MVEGTRLLSEEGDKTPSRVRIPPSPPEVSTQAYFHYQTGWRKGFDWSSQVSSMDDRVFLARYCILYSEIPKTLLTFFTPLVLSAMR